ncbi:sugar phosphate isomerase/epimerase family protein [Chitinophaga caseinilytica]|uniref:sugar phosphate isomerase/epimerase family protein n=1 Tax=Chitinophaga caseinilytica TaxID=2267521 RepID=UPI003C2D7AB4
MSISRREFMRNGLGSAALLGIPAGSAIAAATSPAAPVNPFKLAISTYSYWHFKTPKVPIEKVIDEAAALDVEGVDILHRQMESEDNAYLQKLKRHAFRNGVDLVSLSIHQDFVSPDAAERQKDIDHTIKCIELAYKMGIPCIRLNSGRWGTIKSFDDLMAARGVEPAIPGYTEDDAFKWCIDSIQQCLAKAAECGVMLAIENHWGLTSSPEGLLRIRKAVDSPWMGLLLDTGNFLENPYDKLKMVAPHADFVQAKTYYGGGEWYTLDLDYERIIKIFREANYKGYISIEFEGKEAAETGVRKSVDMLRKAMAKP